MSGHTVKTLDEANDVRGARGLPGEMHMLGSELDTEQVSLTHRRMPPDTGEKGMFGHTHKTQEEIYFVAAGTLTLKLEEELIEVAPAPRSGSRRMSSARTTTRTTRTWSC